MKTTIKTVLLTAIVLAFVLPSCKKYEEGPLISLSSAKSRVVNVWKMEKVWVNSSEITNSWSTLWPSFSMELKNDDTYILTWSPLVVENGTWTFDNPKERIITTATASASSTVYTIIRLKKDEMWVTYSNAIGGENWEYHLVTK